MKIVIRKDPPEAKQNLYLRQLRHAIESFMSSKTRTDKSFWLKEASLNLNELKTLVDDSRDMTFATLFKDEGTADVPRTQ